MFNNVRLFGTPMAEALPLATRLRRPIRNVVGLEAVTYVQAEKFRRMCQSFGWEVRRGPTGIYNCFGHVWASRRTGIYETPEIEAILKDDGYRLLEQKESPRLGDLVLYRLVDTAEVFHVGEVIEMRELKGMSGTRKIPVILSKLDASSGEVFHFVEHVPYEKQGLPYRYEFRTDRPGEEAAR